MTKEHAKTCAYNTPKYDGDARLASNFEMKDCDCDGYHTFDELYDHRITLYIALLRTQTKFSYIGAERRPWRTKAHSDGSLWDGWFILGIGLEKGKQITYHLPLA